MYGSAPRGTATTRFFARVAGNVAGLMRARGVTFSEEDGGKRVARARRDFLHIGLAACLRANLCVLIVSECTPSAFFHNTNLRGVVLQGCCAEAEVIPAFSLDQLSSPRPPTQGTQLASDRRTLTLP